jgi:hypothetical protein
MSYTDKPIIIMKRFETADAADAFADNEDLAIFMIPAGREIEVQQLRGYVTAASDTATDSIELVNEANTVLCQIVVGATGKVAAVTAADQAVAQTFPIRIAPQSTSAVSLLKLKMNGASDTSTTVDLQLHLSGLDAS